MVTLAGAPRSVDCSLKFACPQALPAGRFLHFARNDKDEDTGIYVASFALADIARVAFVLHLDSILNQFPVRGRPPKAETGLSESARNWPRGRRGSIGRT